VCVRERRVQYADINNCPVVPRFMKLQERKIEGKLRIIVCRVKSFENYTLQLTSTCVIPLHSSPPSKIRRLYSIGGMH
jgi:hypothetical protein